MNLTSLIEKQVASDRRRGFAVDFQERSEQLSILEGDLVGLMGEIGEFANLIKKVRLKHSHCGYSGPSFEEASKELSEELADALIYLMRLSYVAGADLETEVIRKMSVNDDRYRSLEE